MVWGMGFDDGFEYSYGFKLLNGNPRKIEYEDTTPELYTCGGHFRPGQMRLGRKMKTDHIPTELIWGGPIGKAPDAFNIGRMYYVSQKFRDACEQVEPGIHQFEEAVIYYKNREPSNIKFFFNVCNRIESVCSENTTAQLRYDRFWDPETGDVIFSNKKIGEHHIWIDKNRMGGPFNSDEIKESFDSLEVSGVHFTKLPSV